MSTTDKEKRKNVMEVQKEKQPKIQNQPEVKTNNIALLLFLSGLFSAFLIGSNFMAVKLFDIAGFTIPVAVILFPFCFVVSNIINEFFGFKKTRLVIIYTFIFNAVVLGFILLGSLIPASAFSDVDDSTYNTVFRPVLQVLLGSFTAFIVSNLLNIYVFDKLKKLWTKGASQAQLAVRASISTFLSIAVDSTIFISIGFAGVLPFSVLMKTILGHIIAKILFGTVLGTPITMLTTRIVKRKILDKEETNNI